jgi:hypothetical protein
MLFVLSTAGVPSVARIMRVGAPVVELLADVSPAAAEVTPDAQLAGTSPTQEWDETVRTQFSGTPVVVGLTAQCPYGLGACWGGAYEALAKLDGVAAVRPTANADDSTAEVYLHDQGLPDLDNWPEQFAHWANASYDFRGVEVTVAGTVGKHDDILQLTGPSLETPVHLMPLQQGMKLQWNYRTGKAADATPDELAAYQRLEGRGEPVRVTGPLTKTGNDWILHVRTFQ